MPTKAPKPSELASEARKIYFPRIAAELPHLEARSIAYTEVGPLEDSELSNPDQASRKNTRRRPRVAVYPEDAVDTALQWNYVASKEDRQDHISDEQKERPRIPLILSVDDKKAGGDWDSIGMGAEECLCRRSNLILCLAQLRGAGSGCRRPLYPMLPKSGIYSPQVGKQFSRHLRPSDPIHDSLSDKNLVICLNAHMPTKTVVFRAGPSENYKEWDDREWNWLPVISVAPHRRPRVKKVIIPDDPDVMQCDSGAGFSTERVEYAFVEALNMMRDNIISALRLAVTFGHRDIVVGSFGLGTGFKNPPHQLSALWRQILFEEEEFIGVFDNVVFAIEDIPASITTPTSSSNTSAAAKGNTGKVATPGQWSNKLDTFQDLTRINNNSHNVSNSNDNNIHSSTPSPVSDCSRESNNTDITAPDISPISQPKQESIYQIFEEEFQPSNLCKKRFP